MGLKPSSYARSCVAPPHTWDPSMSEMNEVNRSYTSPSPSKFRRFGLSGEGLREGTTWHSFPKESAVAESHLCADYNQIPSFSTDRSPENIYPTGINKRFWNEPLHISKPERRDPSSKRRSRSDKRRHRKEPRRNELTSCRTAVEDNLNKRSKQLESSSPRKHSPDKCSAKHSSSPLKVFKNTTSDNWGKYHISTSPKAMAETISKREDLKYSTDENFAKKKKKKKKDRRKSRSRSEEKRKCSTDRVRKNKRPSQKYAPTTTFSPSEVGTNEGTGCLSPCAMRPSSNTKRGRDSPDTVGCTSYNAASREGPDSYMCAIVKKRRTSSQEESAILKFTRVEGQSRGSPRKSGLAGLTEQSQGATPTIVKKMEPNDKAVTPSTEPAENCSQRCSPMRSDIKPKALIKPGLRSAKKEPKAGDDSRRRCKTPHKEDSGRQLVQRTLETYFSKSVPRAATGVQAESTQAALDANQGFADEGDSNRRHVRRIYVDETGPRAVVQLTPVPDGVILKMRGPEAEAAPRGRWGSQARLAEVRPILSPAKQEPCESTEGAARGQARVTRTSSRECAVPGEPQNALHPEEDVAETQRDEAARQAEVTKAAQRNRKRHTRGLKVTVFCDVLQEDIERHPVQNEIPANKWSKWMNPTQLRCLVSAMLDNIQVCLKFSLEAEHNEEWEEYWTKLARRLNSVCFNELTNLNTGLRMTVLEWKTCWLDLKTTMKKRVDAMTAKERRHNLGTLDCLLYSEDLYTTLIKSKGECLGDECPKIWCPGACVGVFCPTLPPRIRTTEE